MNLTGQDVEAFLFYPGLGNEIMQGRMVVSRSGIRFDSESLSLEIPAERLQAEWDDLGERIYLRDSAQPELKIYTLDESILKHRELAVLGHLQGELSRVATRREVSRRLKLILYFAASCVLVVWLGSIATGAMVRSLARRVPPDWEKAFGEANMEALQEGGALLDDTNKVAELTLLASPLVRVVPLGNSEVQFHIMADPDPNAFALPGGHVVVTTGMLEMVDRPEELLGVLAHEMAHVTQKHYAQKIIAASGPLVIFGVFLHSDNGLMNLLTTGSGILIFQSFSREFETEADDVGWNYLVQANIDPRGMISTFEKLKTSEGAASMLNRESLSSHPALEKRIARLRQKWEKTSAPPAFLALTNAVPKPEPGQNPDTPFRLRRSEPRP